MVATVGARPGVDESGFTDGWELIAKAGLRGAGKAAGLIAGGRLLRVIRLGGAEVSEIGLLVGMAPTILPLICI